MAKVKTSLTVGKYKGPGAFFNWAKDYNKQVNKEARRRLASAAFYLRKVSRNSMRPAPKARAVPGSPWKRSKPSPAGSPPRARKGKRLKNIWAEKVNPDTWVIGPVQYPGGGANTSFSGKGDVFQEVGGTGQVQLPMTLQSMSRKQKKAVLDNGAKWPMVWKNSNYKARPYLAPAKDVTVAKFPKLFTNLNVRR
jgi:hypothetical protein